MTAHLQLTEALADLVKVQGQGLEALLEVQKLLKEKVDGLEVRVRVLEGHNNERH